MAGDSPNPASLPGPDGPLEVIAAADRYVVVHKPAWMLSVPGKGPEKADCVAARVAAMFPAATGPLIVHRLDMETSGLMVLALDPDAQRNLSRQFETRRVQKAYIALLGAPIGPAADDPLDAESGEISLPMRADIENRPIQIIDHVHGRDAVTRWRVLGREIDRVRIRFEPLTGRTHQLRLHAAAALFRPIVGDGLYGGEPAPRLMLHAAELTFLDPTSGARVAFASRPPF